MVVVMHLPMNGHEHVIKIRECVKLTEFFFESPVERFLSPVFPRVSLRALARQDTLSKKMSPERRAVILSTPV